MTPETAESGPGYGLVRLRALPDTAVTGGFSETMEARFADEALGGEQAGVSLQRIKPGLRLAFGTGTRWTKRSTWRWPGADA